MKKVKAKKPVTVTIEDAGFALYTSDVGTRLSKKQCVEAASYLLKTSIGLRAAMDGEVRVDLGVVGTLVIKLEPKP